MRSSNPASPAPRPGTLRLYPRAAIGAALLTLYSPNARAQDAYIFTTLAGQAGLPGSNDGSLANARFKQPLGVAVDSNGTVYVVDEGNATIRKITATEVTTFAGSPGRIGATDGLGAAARFGTGIQLPTETFMAGPTGITIWLNNILMVAEGASATVRSITAAGQVTTIAGLAQTPIVAGASGFIISGPPPNVYRDGTGTGAGFISPFAIAADAQGILFVSDSLSHTIRKISGLIVTTYAGLRNAPNSGDGTLLTASFNTPTGLAVDGAGNLFVVDSNNFTIRKIATDGTVSTLAGSPGQRGSADGSGRAARFGGASTSSPPPTSSLLGVPFNGPGGIAIDTNGNVFVADTRNDTLRRITPAGVVTTIGGNADGPGASDGIGSAARFGFPVGIAVDRNGNLFVADTLNHTIRKGTPAFQPRMTAPQGQSATPGQTVTLTVTVTGTPAPGLQWTKNGSAIAGATNATLNLTNVQSSDTGSYALVASNELSTVTSAPALVTVGAVPTIALHPVGQSVLGGQSVALSVTADAVPAASYQWLKDGVPIANATAATLTIASAQAQDAGSYAVRVTNAAGTATSNAATVSVNTSRIVNLSIRTMLSPGAPVLTVGFVVAGDGKMLLVRGVGPALTQFGVAGALADPRMTVYAENTALASNDNWDTAANAAMVATTSTQVGAFALGAGGSDAAVLTAFSSGNFSAQITGPTASTGIVLVELYDSNATSASRLVNVSSRAQVGIGEGVLVAGFVVTGNSPKTLLIRAVGPTLGAFGVTGVLADPRLDIIASGATIPLASNDNWGGDAVLRAAFTAQGAFPLAAADSKDAAVLVTLEPGAYSAQVSGVGATTGEALVEVYEAP